MGCLALPLQVVRAEIALWCTGFVLMTMLLNAPLLSPLLKALGITHMSREQAFVHSQVSAPKHHSLGQAGDLFAEALSRYM